MCIRDRDTGTLTGCTMTDTCRAALWYDNDLRIERCILGGIKALRECDRTVMNACMVNSTEFGWFCRDLQVKDCELTSESVSYTHLDVYKRQVVIKMA